MKEKVLHIVPENRFGGIFTYIERMSSYKKNSQVHFIFKNQPNIQNLHKVQFPTINLRQFKSYLIIIDLLINSPIYIFSILNSDKIYFHTPFMIIHHIFALLIKKESRLIIHDFNIVKIIEILIKIIKPKNTFCVSEVLIRKYSYLQFSKILPPIYGNYDLKLLEKNKFNFHKKADLIFLGNLNRVKQIDIFAKIFFNYINNHNLDINLFIYGKTINKEIFNKLNKLQTNKIFVKDLVPHNKVIAILKEYKFIVIPSESEVFPMVYFEALKANTIPLVNDIDFFRLVSSNQNDHIFRITDSNNVYKVLNWANNLSEKIYMDYIKNLKNQFILYYSESFKDMF